ENLLLRRAARPVPACPAAPSADTCAASRGISPAFQPRSLPSPSPPRRAAPLLRPPPLLLPLAGALLLREPLLLRRPARPRLVPRRRPVRPFGQLLPQPLERGAQVLRARALVLPFRHDSG